MQWAGGAPNMEIPQVNGENMCLVSEETVLTLPHGDNEKVILEDLDLDPASSEELTRWADMLASWVFNDEAWQKLFQKHVCMVHDDVMRFLLDTALDVTARIRLDEETKTVAQGALWYEEALPAETIMAGLMFMAPVKAREEEVINAIRQTIQQPLQIGGSATVGRGLCRLHLVEGKA
jgi:CRISPR-associated protein Cmr4